MKNVKDIRILDETMLKIIAMISMVFDHVGDMFFPGVMWPRMIGRLAMPLFSFCIAEGYIHTRDRKKYILRLGIFALVSEVPFDLAFEGKINLSHQNIMLTFFLAVIGLKVFDLIRGEIKVNTGKYSVGRSILGILFVFVMAGLALVIKADYTVFAVIAVFLFYVLKNKTYILRTGVGVGFLAITRTMGYYCTTGLSIIPLLLYNGKRGKGLKWLFYAFYPGHLLLLYGIKLALSGQ